ncbi:hypothetical protein TNIN_467021 [Trichonephila inaurata madagascariensis]|uniref:Uncharacterized protein n=1 Tax=Trichonephila inaurata madagascariensis TaxID=2747483 RepID=A0A8X6ME55_9ARAC|nr:hypothetical protein TNIN_467021 [Trichonephila inaurata madagascariensis]
MHKESDKEIKTEPKLERLFLTLLKRYWNFKHIGDVEIERRKLAIGVSYSCAPHRQFVIVLTLQVCYSRSVRKSYPIGLPLHVPGC